MRVLPGSPRARRRLARIGVVAALLALVAGVILLLPNTAPPPESAAPPPTPGSEPVAERQIRLTAADRAAIDRTLDVFVPAVVERRDLAAGFDTVTSEMREGQTRAQWARSDPPLMLYPARGKRFHEWTLTWAYPREASIELMLQPREGSIADPVTFNVDLRRAGRRWLVNSIAPEAIFSTSEHRVTAAKDFGASAGSDPTTTDSKLSRAWIAVPLGLLGLIPLVLVAVWIRSWIRNERARRSYTRRV